MKANDVIPCVAIFNYLIYILLLLFKNNVGHSIQMFECLYNYDTWPNVNMPCGSLKMIQNINIRLVGT